MTWLPSLILWGSSVFAILTTCCVLGSNNPVYAILYLVLSLFSAALMFWSLGAPFIAALEILVYAGAIMVLFLFVVMMLNLGTRVVAEDIRRPSRKVLLLPGLFALGLAVLTILAIVGTSPAPGGGAVFMPLSVKALGQALFTRHYLGVELVSLILTIGIVGGMHLGRAASGSAQPEVTTAPVEREKRELPTAKEAA